MQKFLLLVTVGVLAFMTAGCSATKSAVMSEADIITAGHVDEMVADRLYKIDFDRAYPAVGPSLPLTNPYYISVIGDRVESFLPYFGRAYTAPFGGGEGLRFAAPITEYTQTEGRRGAREITFTARTDEDIYDFMLSIFPLGETTLIISPTQKQRISFNGRVDLSPEFEAVRVR